MSKNRIGGPDQQGEARPEKDRLDLDLLKILLGRRREGDAHAKGNKHHPEASRRVPWSSNLSHAATALRSASDDPQNRNTENLAWGCDTVRRMGDDGPEDLGAGAGTPGSPSQNADRDSDNNFDRDLGVVEAITFVTRSCPSGVVISVANQALEAIKTDGPDVIKQQAYFVLTAIQGWRGDRARQVHRSLTKYLEESSSS